MFNRFIIYKSLLRHQPQILINSTCLNSNLIRQIFFFLSKEWDDAQIDPDASACASAFKEKKISA